MNADTIGHPDRDTLAAYCLGGLGAAETAAYDTHVSTCPSCREYLDELAEIRAMLALVPADLVLDDPALAGELPAPEPVAAPVPSAAPVPPPRRTAPPLSRPTAVRPVRAPWYQRPWLPVAAIAAAIVTGAFVIPNLVDGGGDQAGPKPTSTATVISIAGNSSTVVAKMLLTPKPAESDFTLQVTGLTTVTTLHLVAYLNDGSTLDIGRWAVPAADLGGQTLALKGDVPRPASDLSYFVLTDSADNRLAKLSMATASSG